LSYWVDDRLKTSWRRAKQKRQKMRWYTERSQPSH